MEGADLPQESDVRSHSKGQHAFQAEVGRASWPVLVKVGGPCSHRDKIRVRRQLWQSVQQCPGRGPPAKHRTILSPWQTS